MMHHYQLNVTFNNNYKMHYLSLSHYMFLCHWSQMATNGKQSNTIIYNSSRPSKSLWSAKKKQRPVWKLQENKIKCTCIKFLYFVDHVHTQRCTHTTGHVHLRIENSKRDNTCIIYCMLCTSCIQLQNRRKSSTTMIIYEKYITV